MRETVKRRGLSHLPGTPVSDASGSLDAEIISYRETRGSRLLVILALALMTSGILIPSYGQNVINCPSGFSSSGACGVALSGSSGQPFKIIGNGGGVLSGSSVNLQPKGVTHDPDGLIYQTKVNAQAFSAVFTWIPNNDNLAFVVENNTNTANYQLAGPGFVSGAGCEGGFYQGFLALSPPVGPNNIFALEFDNWSYLGSTQTFTYSSVQTYQQNQSPCNPNDSGPDYWLTKKISTSPVSLNSPSGTQGSPSSDTFSATVIETGTNLVLNLYDVTAGGACPGASCFTYTWPINMPQLANGTTAYVGFTAATGEGSTAPLNINSLVYTVLSAATTSTFSPTAGIYAGTQSVTISDSSSGGIICYNTTGAPATNGTTGCTNGTLYTGAISVSSGQTIYAVTGGTGYGDSTVASAPYQIGSTASQPTFNQPAGTYQGNQTVILKAAHGGVICYNTAGSPATDGSTGCTTGTVYSTPITVSSNETLYAIAGGTGFTDSGVGSAAYVINPFAGQAPANSPTYSPLPGTYTGTQTVTLSSTTSGSYICYTLAASPPAILPQTNNMGGCQSGTLYSGPISVSSSQTLYAIAGTTFTSNPSSLVAGTYTIGLAPGTPTNFRYTLP